MDAVRELKKLIDKNGRDYIYDEPYLTYKELMASEDADTSLAGAVLMVLVDGGCRKQSSGNTKEALSRLIQDRCCFKKQMSDRVAEIFISLNSQENKDEWKKNDLAGWKEFQKRGLKCHWKGLAVWTVSNGSISCHYDADIQLKTLRDIKPDKELAQALNKNSFMTANAVAEHYIKKLCKNLDYEFEDYITCDDYYEPVVEDFEIEYHIKAWCKKNGFDMVSCEGDGDDDGYEPTFRRGGW